MRHAKSDWADGRLSDHDRPLNSRGRRDAPEMAKWLEARQAVPTLILASTARRVAETIERMLPHWKQEPLILRSSSLYLATSQTIRDHIRCDAIDADGKRPPRLLVLGHNPGMEQLVSAFTGTFTVMPTAAIALFECSPIDPEDEDAPQVDRLIDIGRPKEID